MFVQRPDDFKGPGSTTPAPDTVVDPVDRRAVARPADRPRRP
jgi:hypothetical protein